MVNALDPRAALQYAKKYFDGLSNSGYVSPALRKDMMKYIFLVDFVETLYPFLTEKDYQHIDMATRKLFDKGGCLFDYTVDCTNELTLGSPVYMGTNGLRRAQHRPILRISQDEQLRGGSR